jgi:hypothetical protein
MVLDSLFRRYQRHLFTVGIILGLLFSYVSASLAKLLFGSTPGIMSVTFLTLTLIPFARAALDARRATIRNISKSTEENLQQYGGFFLGTFFAYLSMTFVLPQLGIDVLSIAKEQFFLIPATAGRDYFSIYTFTSALSNNWYVLLVTFLCGVAWREGGLFFVAWNAAAWGAIFGHRALAAAQAVGANPWDYLIIELFFVIWHTLLEGSAYIIAAVAGAKMNDHVKRHAEQFVLFTAFAALLAWIGHAAITSITSDALLITTLMIVLTCALVYPLIYIFDTTSERMLFTYNYRLFLASISIFIVGVILETIIVSNSAALIEIYAQSAQ